MNQNAPLQKEERRSQCSLFRSAKARPQLEVAFRSFGKRKTTFPALPREWLKELEPTQKISHSSVLPVGYWRPLCPQRRRAPLRIPSSCHPVNNTRLSNECPICVHSNGRRLD